MNLNFKKCSLTFMRLSFIIMIHLSTLSLLLPSFASVGQVMQTKIRTTVKGGSLEAALKRIEKDNRVYFAYDRTLLSRYQTDGANFNGATLNVVLEQLLTPHALRFKEVNGVIVINADVPKNRAVIQESGKLTGTVVDEKGTPIHGVTVHIVELDRDIQTDEHGSYQVDLPEGHYTIETSYISYLKQQIDVDIVARQSTSLKISLEPALTDLDEVVVVGYGTREKKDLTGSVATVRAAQIRDIPVAAIDQKLIGQMPGVQIATTTGRPGGGTTIKIRGAGSIGAGDNPLYVIDGFAISNTSGQSYNPLNVISPDDIESISVLKDASSTAIYGSRGSNGVVMITTKRGKTGSPVVAVNSYVGLQQVPHRGRPGVLNGAEYAQFRKEMIEDDFAARGETPTLADIPEEFRNPADYGAGTDWYDAVLRNAIQNNIDASIRGGSENTTYSFSLGRLEQQGTVRYTDYTRYTLQGNVQSKIGERIQVGVNIAPGGGIQHNNGFETGNRDVLTRTLWLSPIVPIMDAAGNRTPFITSPGAIGAGNPFNTLEHAGTSSKYFRGLASAFAELEVMTGLKVKYSFNVDYAQNNAFTFQPSIVYGETSNPNPNPPIPSSTTSHNNHINWLSELVINYDKTFGTDHRVTATAGYTAQKERFESYGFTGRNYPDDLVETINAAQLIDGQNAGIEKWALLSYLARAEYGYKGRYMVTGTIRTDGSSRFGSNVRYGTFPSGGVAWRISEESFMNDVSWLEDLKLRASYGLAGNFNIGNYAYAAGVSRANYSFGGAVANGRVSTSISNNRLTWENSKQLDVGMDISILKGRIGLILDYYNRITTDMLFNNEIPLSSGFASTLVNLGKLRNNGFEIAVNTTNLTGPLTWQTSFNVSFNRNKVLALNHDNAPIYTGRSGEGNYTHITEVGKPLGQFFGYVQEGVYMDQADFDNSPKNASSVVGSVKYKDIDGDGIIEPVKDFAVIGHPYPDFTYGMTNNLAYKGFDFSVLVVGSQGGQILKTANEFLTNIDGVFNVDKKILNRWRSPENPGDGMTPTTNGGRVLYRDVNSSWVEDASFLRIQNLTLGYNFNPGLLTRSRVFKSLRVYASAQNLVTFTNYSGGNPEALTDGSGVLTPGRDFLSYPLSRTMTLGANITF